MKIAILYNFDKDFSSLMVTNETIAASSENIAKFLNYSHQPSPSFMRRLVENHKYSSELMNSQ